MAASPVKNFLVTFLMPEKCYERIFVNFHMNVPCLKFIMNRIVGFWIILDTFLAQLPQLLKILWRRSAKGLSLTSALLQLYSFSCPVVYAMAHNFPLFAWGERLITLVQTAAIVFLIMHYRGETLKGILFLLTYGGVMFLLGSYAAAAVVSVMQASSLAALIASKIFQAGTNYCNGHTGQLSTLTVLISWAGSLGVIFVSLQLCLVGDRKHVCHSVTHTVSLCQLCPPGPGPLLQEQH
ncbi:mannose-P-dolichol utilization defect 1 protein-like isoform X2 [Cottoperca gobio]|uniref:Mannose-P-dolichol utilization defect 1 protein-like isoform X2 n=1 Tax=Cottoperca gobio TaxID=56716 RepID=A0A6J2R631_COTGO|nr:mannose-P-dolichol utilization defect 1 protein-like isoform X2 [Cottoperca gobio]